MMQWTLIFTSLLLLTCLEDVSAKGGKFGRIFGASPGSSNSDGIFVNNPIFDFLIFLAIVGGILIVIGIVMAAWKAVRGPPSDPAERGLLDSESENDSEYNVPTNKMGKHNYGITNPEEIFTDTKNFVERVGENRQYQKMPENGDNRMDIDSASHRMFDLFDRRPRMASGTPWGSNYQNIQEQPPNYYNSDGYYRDPNY